MSTTTSKPAIIMRTADAIAATPVTVGGGLLAGCLSSRPQFWEDPPSFDATGLDGVLDNPLPDRPQLVPVSFEPAVAAQFVDRVERLLEPIPDPLPEATLPNGEFRSQITTERDEAREILSAHNTDHTPFELAERFAEARYHAAVAAGTWAIVTTKGDSTSVTDGAGTVLSRADQFGEMLPGVATDPLAGAAVYGPIERWLDTADRSTLSRSTSVTRQRDPLGAGQTIGEIERVQSQIEAGKYIQSKYQETVEEPQSIDSEICSEVENLRTDVDEWVQVLYNGEDDQILRFRGIEVFFDTNQLAENAPSLQLLSRSAEQTVGDISYGSVAVKNYEPALWTTTLCRTMLALVRLSACDKLGNLIEDGEDFFPKDGATVKSAREAAIDSVAQAAAAENPLRRWFATQMLPLFDNPENILSAESPSTREIVRAYTEYRWITLLANESNPMTSTVF